MSDTVTGDQLATIAEAVQTYERLVDALPERPGSLSVEWTAGEWKRGHGRACEGVAEIVQSDWPHIRDDVLRRERMAVLKAAEGTPLESDIRAWADARRNEARTVRERLLAEEDLA